MTNQHRLQDLVKSTAERAERDPCSLDGHEITLLAQGYLELREQRGLPGKLICYPSVKLVSGAWYDFQFPENSTYIVEDIAHGLAKQGRMVGQNRNPNRAYSIAQHCVMGSHAAPEGVQFEFLMHDAPEFVYGDMTTPLKQCCPDYKAMLEAGEAEMAKRYGLPSPMSKACKLVDLKMFATEARDLMTDQGEGFEMLKDIEPYEFKIEEWDTEFAFDAWLSRFHELWPKHAERHGIPEWMGQ